MPQLEPDALLLLLRDPNRESHEVATAAGVPRDEAARAARLALGIGKAKPEDVTTLPAPLAVAVLRAAAAAGRADILAAAAAHAQKEIAKEGKRALWLLRSRGVAVPDPPRPAPAPPAAAPEATLPCYASTIDGHGERALWIGRNVPGKGVEVAQAIVSDTKGLAELRVGLLGRKEYRAFTRDILERGHTMGVAEIDAATARAIVAAARTLNDAANALPPEGADAWLARAGPAGTPPDPAARFAAPLPDDEERVALEASARLHDLPLLRGWLADEDALRALAAKLDEVAVSPLYLDEQQRAEAGLRLVAEAVEAAFDPASRRRWAARLFSVAEHLERSGDSAHAPLAAAAARALLAGTEAARIPFARLLVEKAFPAPEIARERRSGAGGPGESSLIIPPIR
jgi:hypothetical protein